MMKIRRYTCSILRCLALSVSCILLWGCNDDSYLYANNANYYSTPMEIKAKVGIMTDTQKSVSLEAAADNRRQINVYSFRKLSDVDYRITAKENNRICLLDGSLDPNGSAGKIAYVQQSFEYIEWKYNNPVPCYPSGTDYTKSYDFFAFGAGNNNKFEESRYRDSVTVDFEIDGQQDVISAVGEYEPDIDKGIIPYTFSYYSAMRNSHPVFQFKHHCVKLQFQISPGKTPPSRKYIVVDSISVTCRKHCRLVTVSRDTSKIVSRFLDETPSTEFFLKDSQGNKYLNLVFRTIVNDETKVEPVLVDALIYASPNDEYTVNFYMKEAPVLEEAMAKRSVGTSDIVKLSKGQCFKIGYSYTISATVTGVNNLYMTGELTSWKEGDDLSIVSGDD